MPVHRDVAKGNIEAVSRALDVGESVDVPDDLERTPLMVAVSSPRSNRATVQYLLERGANPNAEGGLPYRPVLGHALFLNDPERVRLLLDAGADIAYTSESGDDVLMWSVQGDEAHLPEVVDILLERGASVAGEDDEGQSALSLASGRGRFDIVKRLLEAGADEFRLGWTPFMRAVALGTPADVQQLLEQGADLSTRDPWERTPWLLALAVGDLHKIRLLLAAGANRNDAGPSGKTALMYPIETKHPEILKWLVTEQFDLDATDDAGRTALMEAASQGSYESVRFLLGAGADASKTDHDGLKALDKTHSSEVLRLLAAEEQDLNDLTPSTRALLLGLDHEGDPEVSRTDYEAERHPRFGTANPEKMDVPFWNAMVRSGATSHAAHQKFASENGLWKQDDEEPVWTYHREGKSLTPLPDGRFVEIGGSHEDWYELHFHVYNDVIVHYPDGHFDIYGYPAEVFPPTDFHSATLVDNFIYIIGCMGRMDQRTIGHTAVYRLNVETFAIERIETKGKPPGCISMHQGTLTNNEIHVCGGECTEVFILNLDTHEWRHQPNRN